MAGISQERSTRSFRSHQISRLLPEKEQRRIRTPSTVTREPEGPWKPQGLELPFGFVACHTSSPLKAEKIKTLNISPKSVYQREHFLH